MHGESIPSTAIASFYAPHVGCPESDCLAFWQRLSNSIGEVLQAVPGVDVVIAHDSNFFFYTPFSGCRSVAWSVHG